MDVRGDSRSAGGLRFVTWVVTSLWRYFVGSYSVAYKASSYRGEASKDAASFRSAPSSLRVAGLRSHVSNNAPSEVTMTSLRILAGFNARIRTW